MGGHVSQDMYVGIHDPLPEDSDDEAGPPITSAGSQPLLLPVAIRPALKGERKVVEGSSGDRAVDHFQIEMDGLTAQILALVDKRARLEERRKERVGKGAGAPKRSSPSGPVPCGPPVVALVDVAPRRSYASATASGASQPVLGDQLAVGGGGQESGASKGEASRKRRERRRRSGREATISEPPSFCSPGRGGGGEMGQGS